MIISYPSIIAFANVSSEYQTGTVTNCVSFVNVRSGPGTGYSKLGTARKDTVYNIIGTVGSWYKINYNGKIGPYIFYLSVTYNQASDSNPGALQIDTIINCQRSANVCSGPAIQN
ncbi:MAG: SH3 domain-containing protein [Christensenellales bacterium]|jgi:uncharacterized protein YgiM (DUF1202 family)